METQFPDDFKCPISLEIMSDPVILSSGHTFDRESIQRWLDAGHRSCPITKLPLPDHPSLIPNHALRSLISNFAPVRSPPPNGTTVDLSPQAMISVLTSKSSSPRSKLYSLTQLNRLSKNDLGLRKRITESGAVSAVLNCVRFDGAGGVSGLQEKALSLLLNLSLDDDNKIGLVAEGAIGRVVNALRVGSSDCRALAATIITSLAVMEVNKATIGDYPSAIQALVSLLQAGKLIREKKEATTALYALTLFPDNRKRVINCGAVPILIQIVDLGIERAVEVLSVLARCKEGREEIMRVDGCVKTFVRMLKNGSPRAVQCSLFTLNSLCCCNEQMTLESWKEGVFDICSGLLDDDDNKVRNNANNFIQTLNGKPSMR
ncbi:hypothetical protein EZV62_026517 [Acer yangbiense]|uniref:RING-type E3 ubiquitin transferase n=1 Tax=Acer yangbiense TaxID=1000413 RepID=A0A5C7GRI5_9ROSI|nr:hypothetical protein EZV62_026517 [Acer yangbiense]